MTSSTTTADRRSDIRLRSEDIIRWKRPGRVEDHKAWAVDRSEGGLGFLTLPNTDPRVGECIHLRVLDRAGWVTVDRAVRIARTSASASGDLIMVGCTLDDLPNTDLIPAESPVDGIRYPW